MDKDMLKAFAAGQVRHLVTLAGGYLIGVGALQSGTEPQFVEIGSGILMWALAAAWSWWQKDGQAAVADALKRVTSRGETAAAVVTANAAPPGAAVKALLAALWIGMLLAILAPPASAQQKRVVSPLQPARDVFSQLAAKVRDTKDLEAADALASAIDPDTGKMADEVAHACYQAEIKFFGGLPPPPSDASPPGPAVVFERARLIRLRVQNGLPTYLKIGCAPLVQDEGQLFVKIAAMVGVTVGTGGLALPAIPGLLPALPLLMP